VGETRKLAAILVSDVVGYSRLTGAEEDRILARFRTLRSDLIDPTIAVHHGRIVKRTGDCASASEFDPFFVGQFNALPRRSAFGPHAELQTGYFTSSSHRGEECSPGCAPSSTSLPPR
jgi:class 3 adenylate cyclase